MIMLNERKKKGQFGLVFSAFFSEDKKTPFCVGIFGFFYSFRARSIIATIIAVMLKRLEQCAHTKPMNGISK